MKKSQEVIDAEKRLEEAIIKQEKRYFICHNEEKTLEERAEICSREFEMSMEYGDKWIDQPLHHAYEMHKDSQFILGSILCLVFMIVGYFYDEMFFGISCMFSMMMGFIWLSILVHWIKVWIRGKRI